MSIIHYVCFRSKPYLENMVYWGAIVAQTYLDGVTSSNCHLNRFQYRFVQHSPSMNSIRHVASEAVWQAQPSPAKSKNPLKRLDRYLGRHETSFERMAHVRNAMETNISQCHNWDRALACPERYNSRIVSGLIYASKYLEEVAESVADISGLVERLSRNSISGGNKCDMAKVMGAGLGRVVSGFLNTPGFSIHKVAGTGIYGLSVLTGGLAIVSVRILDTKKESYTGDSIVQRGIHFDKSIYQEVAGVLANGKARLIDRGLSKLEKAGFDENHKFQKWCRHLSANHAIRPFADSLARRTHCSYMWNNLHQYGPVTRSLMYLAYGTFQGINKTLGSYDKYLGAELSKRFLAKKVGSVFGSRLGLLLSTGLAAGMSVPMAPLVVGLSTIGACACAFALLALLAAKMNVKYGHDWHGSFIVIKSTEPASKGFRFSVA